jgi:hypothetical protein
MNGGPQTLDAVLEKGEEDQSRAEEEVEKQTRRKRMGLAGR